MKALEAAGLKAVVAPEPVNDRNVPKGAVVAQDPASGNLTKGGTVTLTISKGPKLVEVPASSASRPRTPRKPWRSSASKSRSTNILGGFFGTVRDQDPVDTKVPEGSTITLTVV